MFNRFPDSILLTLIISIITGCSTPETPVETKVIAKTDDNNWYQGRSTEGTPPKLDVVLTPGSVGDKITRIDVKMTIEAPGLAGGQKLLRMPTTLVSIPTAGYEDGDIIASDDKGTLVLTSVDEESTPTGVYRHWIIDRATVGDVEVRFGTAPREVNSTTRNGPLFDIRDQGNGFMGSGVYFFALPATKNPFSISMAWDLSKSPEGTRGIWSLGEGAQNVVSPVDTLAFSYYAVGPVKSIPEKRNDSFGIYWLTKTPFNMDKLAVNIKNLYDYMATFFNDEDAPYRVFVRSNPHPGGGGSALAKSFMFGFGTDGETAKSGPQMLIAHEMAHNWPRLNGGEPHAETAWYTEGNAEFYSALLALRAGVIDLDKFLSEINSNAVGYYTNPYIKLANKDAGKIFWNDARAQKVPYGRGFMYLVQVDAQIRSKSNGKRSLDDLVKSILERQNKGEKIGLSEWKEILVTELGGGAAQEFEDMISGKFIVPSANSFGPCFSFKRDDQKAFELGFDRMSLGKVKGLIPNSEAAKSGVRENDIIIKKTPLKALRGDPKKMMEITVQRDGKEYMIKYSPYGTKVPAWQWVRNTDISEDQCGL